MTFLNPSPTRLGIVCLARLTFDYELAAQYYLQAQQMLGAIDGVELCPVKPLVVELPDADAAVAELRAANIDALVILNGTFALGGLAMRLAQALDVPILLWAWTEPKEQTGKLRFNSLVGVHTNASNLYKLGYRPTTLYGGMEEPHTRATIAQFARVAGVARDLRQMRIAAIGGHAPGFDNLAVDKIALRRALGVEVNEFSVQTLVARAEKKLAGLTDTPALPFDDTSEVTQDQQRRFAALVGALREFAAEGKFDAFAVKCWGDLIEAYGIAGCGVASLLNDGGLVTGCEGDVMGAVTALIARRLSGEPPFLTDLVAVERAENVTFLWHIGCAPFSQADPNQPKHLFSHFMNGKGLTAGFALKPGRVTILRVGTDGSHFRMIATTGRALATEMNIRGTVARVAFDGSAGAFLDELLANGWEHHLVMAYGDIAPELELLARTLDIPFTLVKR